MRSSKHHRLECGIVLVQTFCMLRHCAVLQAKYYENKQANATPRLGSPVIPCSTPLHVAYGVLWP